MDFLLWAILVLCIFALVFILSGEVVKRERLNFDTSPRPTLELVRAAGTVEDGLWSELHYIMRRNGSYQYVLAKTSKAKEGGYFVHLFDTDVHYSVPKHRAPFDSIYIESHLDIRYGLSRNYRMI